MSVEIQDRIVASGHGTLNPRYFCVHSTANPGATAANHVSYWSNNPDYAVHLVSDWNECFHTVPYNALCWQVGSGNKYVEGIEICEATNYDDFMLGIEIAADVVAQRLAAHGWGIERLICHDEARRLWGGTDHTDPIPYFNKFGCTWQDFKNLVDAKMKGEDMNAQDVWDYGLGSEAKVGDNDIPAWQHLSYAHWDTARMYEIIGRTDDCAAGEDETKYEGNIYERVCYVDKRVREMSVQIPALMETIKTLAENVGADPEEIAAKVAAAVEKKLESIDLSVTVD